MLEMLKEERVEKGDYFVCFYVQCSYMFFLEQFHVHDQNDIPGVRDTGMAAAVGTHTMVSLSMLQVGSNY